MPADSGDRTPRRAGQQRWAADCRARQHRAPSGADIQNARLEERLANTDATRQQAQNSTALASQRVASEAQQMGSEVLNQQRL